eukprot:TRINITY_DN33_c0_g1_i2.p1 TRINITY_DN33_c0_g1~~TRINITY_DN33_c0_g1_i2.p1  ORF type:complete len:267 (-),score=127.74 TRINITY_DN33_c0_g1_i2:54-746(-)
MAVEQTRIDFDSENKQGSCPGYLINSDNKKFAVIVLQEWWGVNQQIKEKAQQLTQEFGFATLIPDLYRGNVAIDHEHAGHLMNGLDWPGAVQDIRGAARYLKSIGYGKVGVTGFCMGGALSIAGSVLVEEIGAGVCFYGIPSKQLADPANLRVPLQLHFGTEDKLAGFSDPAAANALAEVLRANNATFELFFYEGADHAFTNHTGPNYKPEYAHLASTRMASFFQTHLGN